MQSHQCEVAVLGAGLTGAGVALELARAGRKVVLLEQDERAVHRASLRNEGKIHLGFIYANDTSFATAALQLAGALDFRRLLARWLGRGADALALSTPFVYVVAHDSLLDPDALAEHYARVEDAWHAALRDDATSEYLGLRPTRLFGHLPRGQLPAALAEAQVRVAFHTEERAIDTAQLAELVRSAVANAANLAFRPLHRVESVSRTAHGFVVEGLGPEGAWRLHAAQVVNALWEERIRVDRMVGVPVTPGWVHRLKFRVIARLPDALRGGPSVTMVLGRYGDVVVRADGTAYLSWYPAGLQGWSHDVAPPAQWQEACRGEAEPEQRRQVAKAILQGIEPWYPGIARAQPLLVDAGAIVAYGERDIHEKGSGLHDRTRIGVTSHDGYHSIDPGKLTTAPRYAYEAAQRVLRFA